MLRITSVKTAISTDKQALKNNEAQLSKFSNDLQQDSFEKKTVSFKAAQSSTAVVLPEAKRVILIATRQFVDPALADLSRVTSREMAAATERSTPVIVDGSRRKVNPDNLAPETVRAIKNFGRQAIVL